MSIPYFSPTMIADNEPEPYKAPAMQPLRAKDGDSGYKDVPDDRRLGSFGVQEGAHVVVNVANGDRVTPVCTRDACDIILRGLLARDSLAITVSGSRPEYQVCKLVPVAPIVSAREPGWGIPR